MDRRQFSAPSVLEDCKDMELTNGQERGHGVGRIMYSDTMELVEPTVVIKNGAFFYVPFVFIGLRLLLYVCPLISSPFRHR